MKLSTRGRYGTRLVLDLSIHYGRGPILLKDIAKRTEITEKYLWQLIAPLKNAGLINSTRGASGGYELAKNPKQISLKDVIYVLEGSMCLVDCVDNACCCSRSETCVSRDIWMDISEKITQTLESNNFADMVEKFKSKQNLQVYSI
ncbi:MAG: Rrf2 family transcriptional regulator [Candidatus Omnitrophica bacterium]|nr:Rrf2 family transcriptional regulator [Candidatus Omnitrophota bacterium]MBU4334756.1 Rrf2 family transcriptional regulator [Candidatus Omnitrophota bacterium]